MRTYRSSFKLFLMTGRGDQGQKRVNDGKGRGKRQEQDDEGAGGVGRPKGRDMVVESRRHVRGRPRTSCLTKELGRELGVSFKYLSRQGEGSRHVEGLPQGRQGERGTH